MIKGTSAEDASTPIDKLPATLIGVSVVGYILLGVYVVALGHVNDNRYLIVGLIVPVFLVILFTKYAQRILLGLMVLSLMLSARFRLTGLEFHTGGAEAALAPIDFAIFGLLFWMALRSIRHKNIVGVPLVPVTLALPLFFVAHLPSLWIAPDSGLAFLELLRLAKMGVLILVLSYYVRSRGDLLFVIATILVSIGIQGVLAIAQAQFGLSLGLGFLGERDDIWVLSRGSFTASRAGGTLGHANALAHFLEMMLPLALAITISRLPRRIRWAALAAFGLGITGLYLTLSRAGWGAALFGFAVVLLQNQQWRVKRHRRRILSYVLIITLVLLLLALALWPMIDQRITQFGAGSWYFRLRTYEAALDIARDHPWLGIGANNYLQVAAPYNEGVLHAWPDAIVHNAFLLILAETGLIGFSAFLFFLGNVWHQARRAIRDNDHLKSTVAVGVWGGICALLVHSLLGWLFRYDPVFTLFWFHVGLLVALWRIPSGERVGIVSKPTNHYIKE